ncbi:hypothetical protein [Paenibacillus sp. FSL R5-0912]|uniref:hypothetical protein n=1 Tax=Paenibacillus sp. FSL R5-0912 TaxID=1536771 RepID=UPI000AEAA1FB|nr:hypothetical protein [Paenibacillus sp. FSL R5-0912]
MPRERLGGARAAAAVGSMAQPVKLTAAPAKAAACGLNACSRYRPQSQQPTHPLLLKAASTNDVPAI